MTRLKSLLIDNASELGISEIGFTKISDLDEEYSRFKSWLAKGYHGDMKWLEKHGDKRSNPRKLLDWEAGTAIVCLFSYNTGRYYTDNLDKERKGKIAQYAWGRDYHDVVPKILKQLVSKVSSSFGEELEYKIYCDTGPILERELAIKAGVGWRGKNSLILNKKYGSYQFIGILFINEEIESDKPVLDRCGTCTLCMDNCPTNAIVQPYIVDSTKCISYITIENPMGENKQLDRDDWIYGCDVCQQVCPYNNIRNPLSPYESFYQLNFGTEIHPDDLLKMSESEYNIRKKKSAIKRAGLDGLKRNAINIVSE